METAERNKALRETLKQVLRLTKGWDVARDHVRKAVETDMQLRVYHPDGRTEVGLVFKCGSYNVIDINRPVGECCGGCGGVSVLCGWCGGSAWCGVVWKCVWPAVSVRAFVGLCGC